MKQIRKQKEDKPMVYGVCFGLASAVFISLIGVCIIAALISNERLSGNVSNLAMPAIQLLSAFVGCVVAGITVRDDKAIASGIVSVSYYTLLIGISALLMEGISGGFWVGLISVAIGYLGAIFLCTREKTSARGSKRRRAHG